MDNLRREYVSDDREEMAVDRRYFEYNKRKLCEFVWTEIFQSRAGCR